MGPGGIIAPLWSMFLKREVIAAMISTNRAIIPLASVPRNLGRNAFITMSRKVMQAFLPMINSAFRDIMIKHKMTDQINDEMQQNLINAAYVMEVDYSKFDSTVRAQILEIENKFMSVIS